MISPAPFLVMYLLAVFTPRGHHPARSNAQGTLMPAKHRVPAYFHDDALSAVLQKRPLKDQLLFLCTLSQKA